MTKAQLPTPHGEVTLAEIQDVLANPGYSSDERRQWINAVLSEASRSDRKRPRQFLDAVKSLIDNWQDGDPIAKDTL